MTTEEGCSSGQEDLPVQAGFDDLPDELVVKIFSNLTTNDLLTKVARVSKRFHRLSQDPDAHFVFKFYNPSSRKAAAAIKFLKGKNKIQEVEMDCDDDEVLLDIFKLAVMDQKKTTSLDLSGDFSCYKG